MNVCFMIFDLPTRMDPLLPKFYLNLNGVFGLQEDSHRSIYQKKADLQ